MIAFRGKLFAVPWQCFRINAESNKVILAMSKDQLKDSAGFSKDNWPSITDSRWAEENHRIYGVRPYWNETSAVDRP